MISFVWFGCLGCVIVGLFWLLWDVYLYCGIDLLINGIIVIICDCVVIVVCWYCLFDDMVVIVEGLSNLL